MVVRDFLTLLIRFYRSMISPFLGLQCRFYPSCSAYAEEAVQKKGASRGILLALKRLLCCHPWHRGGYEPLE